MTLPTKNVLFISHKHEISAVIHNCVSLWTHAQHQADSVLITWRLETHATCSYTRPNSSWVECASSLLLIPFWLEANYKSLKYSHFFLLTYFSGPPTSFCHHLPHFFHTTDSALHQQLSKVREDWNRADWLAHNPIRHPLRHNFSADTTLSTAMLPMQPPTIWPRTHI